MADLYRRALAAFERLLAANPDSAEAAPNLMVSHERMSQGLAAGTDVEAPVRALEHQRQAPEDRDPAL